MSNHGQFETIRYVIYDIATKRPISQGTCQRRDFNIVVQGLPHGQGGDGAKILTNDAKLDLEPYDILLDPNVPDETGMFAHMRGGAAAYGKTVDDAITSIDDIDTE